MSEGRSYEAETGCECGCRDCGYLVEFHCLAFPQCRKASLHSLLTKAYAACILVPQRRNDGEIGSRWRGKQDRTSPNVTITEHSATNRLLGTGRPGESVGSPSARYQCRAAWVRNALLASLLPGTA